MSGPDAVATLLAVEEIKRLKARYFHAVDDKDWPTLAALFTPDAVVDFSAEASHYIGHIGFTDADAERKRAIVRGGAAAAARIRGSVGHISTVHHGHDPIIDIDSLDSAHGLWSMYDRLEYSDEVFEGYGYYRESYVRIDGDWLITSLRLDRLKVVWTRSQR